MIPANTNPGQPDPANPDAVTHDPAQRRSEPGAPVLNPGFQLNHPTIVSLLYLGAFVTGITAIIGLVLAYLWKDEDANSWAASHGRYLIRTFWIGLLYSVIVGISWITIILIPLIPVGIVAIMVWWVVRCVKSLLAAQKQQPISDPATWLV